MKHVTIVFKNAIQIEGSLLSLENNEMVLQSLDGVSSTVIPDVAESVLFYKVNDSKEVFDVIAETPHKTQDDLARLAKARGDLNTIERNSIREKMQTQLVPLRKDQYVSRNQSFPSPIQHTEKKAARTDTKFSTGLQSMFDQKH